MENGPFVDGSINSMVIFHGYVSHNQMVAAIVAVFYSLLSQA